MLEKKLMVMVNSDDPAYFGGYLNKNLKLFSKLFVKKNLSRKDCILLPFKAMKKIVSN